MHAAVVGKLRCPAGEESEDLKEVVEGVCGRQETTKGNLLLLDSKHSSEEAHWE